MENKKTFLGVGWKFPPAFERRTGSVMLVSEDQDIRESLTILLSTKPGERIMMPEYGCDLHAIVFESINSSLVTEIKGMIRDAVLYFEPRIILDEIIINENESTEGCITIELRYTIRKTNKRSNMVYPYYIIEGNEARFRPLT